MSNLRTIEERNAERRTKDGACVTGTVYVLRLLNRLPDHFVDIDTYDTPREACEGADKYMAAHKEWDAMRLRPLPFPREVRVVERTTTETVVGTWVK